MAAARLEGAPRLRIGVDTGGTFTDVVAVDEIGGALLNTKVPSTPADPSQAFLTGVTRALEALGAAGGDVAALCHGTTVATNALLAEDFSGLGFVTTAGFRHVLEIARQSVPDSYGNSYFWVKPERIVPLHLVAEVPERLDHAGAVLRPLDRDAVARVARWFAGQGVGAVAVTLLHAYANPAHERQVREVFAAEYPQCAVSISSDVLREYREYERSVTTCVDAFVKPRVAAYVAGIAAKVEELRTGLPFYVMKSNGGVVSAGQVAEQPITTILSGPAAGVLGAALVAGEAGFDRVLTLDGGGTSTDVSVVAGGEPSVTTEGTVGRFPVKVPMVDVVTVGTGGGSVAWVPEDGGLKVGPRSAGADPGPLCYRRGGTEPTVTDAHLVLGRIPPHLLGGEIPLDAGAAQAGLEQLAATLRERTPGGRQAMDVQTTAAGILQIAAWNQANAIRQVTVRRGLDVRDFAMAAFGGSGPLLAATLVDVLGLRAAIVPPSPGNLSAFGLLTVDVRNDEVQTFVARHADLDVADLARGIGDLEDRAAQALRREGFADDEHVFLRGADLRYFGQAFEVRVAAPSGPVDAGFADKVLAAFHDAHEALYGYCYRDDPTHTVEWVNLRVTGVGPIRRPTLPRPHPGDGDPAAARAGARPVFFADAWHDTALYARERLRPGDRVTGPAVVQEFGSTLPLPPGFAATVDAVANLIVAKQEPGG